MQTRGHHRFFLTVVDDHTRNTWVTLLQHKSDAFEALTKFVKCAVTQFNQKVRVIRSDNALEFKDTQCQQLYDESGIVHQTSCVHTAQQNGRVERKHRNILEMARCLRFQAGLPKSFWGDCVLTAAYLTNRLPTPLLHNKTTFEILQKYSPTYTTLRVFGCLAFAHNNSPHSDKLNPRGIPCAFIGYPATQKGYRLLNLFTHEVFVSRDIKWYEHILPYTLNPEQLKHLIPPSPDHPQINHTPWEYSSDEEPDDILPPSPNSQPPPASPSEPDSPTSPPQSPADPPTLRKSTRHTQPPGWLKD